MSTTSLPVSGQTDQPRASNRSRDRDVPRWPKKYNVCGVMISATDYDETVDCLIEAAEDRQSAVASFFAVHAVVTAGGDEALKRAVNDFEIIGPDGQPVRWALRWLHGVRLADRVYGPELTLRLCRRAAQRGLPIYLYGGANEGVLDGLESSLREKFPEIVIAGREVPPFRALTPEEDDVLVERINASGAAIVLIGLGCPKQDLFAAAHRDRLSAVQVCVGAAFDFHAGMKSMAPEWMQRRGLEWFYRLCQEPRRLARRYAATNSVFLARLALALAGRQS
jgi:N-acetylglucosaminyldiphosphoundecaprenol N-acetyl-beta-D-mannosaminyltransferase